MKCNHLCASFPAGSHGSKGLGCDFLWITQRASIRQELHWQTTPLPGRLRLLY